MYFCFLSHFLIQPTAKNLWITKLATSKKNWAHKITTRKDFIPTKYQNKKFWTPKYPGRHDDTRPTRPTMACNSLNLVHLNKWRNLTVSKNITSLKKMITAKWQFKVLIKINGNIFHTIVKSLICVKSLILTQGKLNKTCYFIIQFYKKGKEMKNTKHNRHIGPSLLFIFSLDKWNLL